MQLSNSQTHDFLMHYGGLAVAVVLTVAAAGWIFSLPMPKPLASRPAPAHVAPAHTVPAGAAGATPTAPVRAKQAPAKAHAPAKPAGGAKK